MRETPPSQRHLANGGGSVNYEPNNLNGPVQRAAFDEPPLRISGDAARYDHREGNDDYTQAGNLFRLMNQEQRERLFGNIARHMQAGDTSRDIQLRQLCHFFRADSSYGSGVAKALGIDLTGMVPERAERPEALAATK